MSCPHGNHPDNCDICDEVEAAYKSGAENTRQNRDWVGLTDEQVDEIVDAYTMDNLGYDFWTDGKAVARAVEADLKERNK